MSQRMSHPPRLALAAAIFAALAAMPSAQALTPTQVEAARAAGTLRELRLTGSSAMRYLLANYIQVELAQPGSLDIYFDAPEGANHRAYAFLTKTAIGSWPVGTPLLITKRDVGDAQQAVAPLLNGGDATQQHMQVGTTCIAAPGGVSPAVDVQAVGYLCTGTLAAKADAGFTDIEPSLLQTSINGGAGLETCPLSESPNATNCSPPNAVAYGIYGVAVNKKLYLALQKAQGLVPLAAAQLDESPALQPSLPTNFIAGALTGGISGSLPTQNGWNDVIPPGVDSNINNKRVNVCRMIPGAGVQAASNAYFSNAGCTNAANQSPVTNGGKTYTPAVLGTNTVRQNESQVAVENCLAALDQLADPTGGGYGFAVMNAGNPGLARVNGVLVDRGYRFVKLSRVAPTRDEVIAGNYSFFYEAFLLWPRVGELNAPNADVFALLTQMRTRIGAPDVLAKASPDFQDGYIAPTRVLSGAWQNTDPLIRPFISRTNRKVANSCSPTRMTK